MKPEQVKGKRKKKNEPSPEPESEDSDMEVSDEGSPGTLTEGMLTIYYQ